MTLFGGRETPTFHGIASAVDYLCGYLGTYAGVLALYARERRGDGRGDWAETSLCNAATLIQLLFQRPGREPSPSARGCKKAAENAVPEPCPSMSDFHHAAAGDPTVTAMSSWEARSQGFSAQRRSWLT